MNVNPTAVRSALHVALVEPEIHWNTGNAGRTCLATDSQLHLVEPLGFSLDARQVRRAGLDYWQHVAPRLWPDWEQFELALPDLGEPFFFSAEAPRAHWEVEYPLNSVLIFGSETRGLSADLRDRFEDRLVAIPQEGQRVRSLNLSTAVGIAIYEVRRQNRQGA